MESVVTAVRSSFQWHHGTWMDLLNASFAGFIVLDETINP
jgi:hypothetical protein